MIAGAPNGISSLEPDLDVCFFQKKGSNALEAFYHWPQFNGSTIKLRTHSLVPASLPNQGFNEGLDTWTELQSCIYHSLHPEIQKECQGTTVGTL
jgi:hypothetical protein